MVNPSDLILVQLVELSSSPGEDLVGSLLVPPNLSKQDNTTLTTSVAENGSSVRSNGQVLVSAILNITLTGSRGDFITQLETPLTICLTLLNNTKRDASVCLSFYEKKSARWQCVDECLTSNSRKGDKDWTKEGTLLCGQTDHLTNFALLLQGSEEQQQQGPCHSPSSDVLAWLSLGMVAGAILVILFSVVAIEFRFRWRTYAA